MIWENLLRRLDAGACLMRHVTNLKGLSTREKSSYYRAILIILCSITEGFVYEIVRKNTTAPDHAFEKTSRYTEVSIIKSAVLGTSSDIHLYRRVKVDLKIDDEGASFARLNLFLKHKHLVTDRQYKTLDWIRTERNKLHVQGLADSDINYTDAKVKRVARALKFLIKKV